MPVSNIRITNNSGCQYGNRRRKGFVMTKFKGMQDRLQKRLNAAKTSTMCAAASIGMLQYMVPVNAKTSITPATVHYSADSDTIVNSVIGIILKVAQFIGAAMLIWGLVMFGLAIKNDEPDSKQKALMTTFAGVILIGLRTILQTAKIIS